MRSCKPVQIIPGIAFVCAMACAQSSTTLPQSVALPATFKVDASLTTDRAKYFPFEAVTLSVKVSNPTNQTLEIQRPFSLPGRLFELHVGPQGLEEMESEPDLVGPLPISTGPAPPVPDLMVPILALAPADSKTVSIRSYDYVNAQNCWLFTCQAPDNPGTYELEYQYGRYGEGVRTRFDVVAAQRVSSVAVEMPKDTNTWEGRTLYAYRSAFELRADGVSYLCIEVRNAKSLSRESASRVASRKPGSRVEPFVRVAQSTFGFPNLALTTDDDGILTLRWTDEHGKTHVLKFGSESEAPERE